MKSESFVYWLQGFFELSEADTLNEKQVRQIKNHLNLVFHHSIDPETYGEDGGVSQAIHDGVDPQSRATEAQREALEEAINILHNREQRGTPWQPDPDPRIKC